MFNRVFHELFANVSSDTNVGNSKLSACNKIAVTTQTDIKDVIDVKYNHLTHKLKVFLSWFRY